jgi:uncharacterized protein YxeA
MKNLLIIILVFVASVATAQTQQENDARIDHAEEIVQLEYQLHDLDAITNHLLVFGAVHKNTFEINGRTYKIKRNKKDINKVFVKHRHREYVYNINGSDVTLWSHNLNNIMMVDYDLNNNKKRIVSREVFDDDRALVYVFKYELFNDVAQEAMLVIK